MKHEIPISILNWNGDLLTQTNPPQSKTAFIRMAQYQAFNNTEKRVSIAAKFITAKIKNTEILMQWLLKRYPHLEKFYNLCNFERRLNQLNEANSIKNIMSIEAVVANLYWKAISQIPFSKFEFNGRTFGKTQRPLGATDEVTPNPGLKFEACSRCINPYY
jgi:CRISPR-associated protein Cas1